MHQDIILRSASSKPKRKLVQDDCRKSKKARQILVLCRLMIDVMRTVHCTYAPASERFGTHLETFFVALCVAIGDIDGKPFCVAKIADYMSVPRTTVIRKLDQLQSWGLIARRGPLLLHARKRRSIPLTACEATKRYEAFWPRLLRN